MTKEELDKQIDEIAKKLHNLNNEENELREVLNTLREERRLFELKDRKSFVGKYWKIHNEYETPKYAYITKVENHHDDVWQFYGLCFYSWFDTSDNSYMLNVHADDD